MSYDQLFAFLEGDDDERFFDVVLRPRLEESYQFVRVVKYAGLKAYKIESYITSIEGMGANYVFLRDINRAQCITAKKSELVTRYRNLGVGNILLVVKEIECWYLAGISTGKAREMNLRVEDSTDHLTKEDFDALRPKRFVSRVDFMAELLRFFSIPLAKSKNRSFRYFAEKNGLSET